VTGLQRLLARGLGLTGAVTLVALGVAPGSLGCQTHECDPDFVCVDGSGLMKFVSQASDCTPTTRGDTPIAGHNGSVITSVDPMTGKEILTWYTSSLTGPWLDYPGNRTYIVNFPWAPSGPLASESSFPIQVDAPSAWISADNPDNPDAAHANFIGGPGYVVEFSNVTPDQLTVINASCSRYSLLIEAQVEVTPDAGSAAEAGSPEDAGDAGSAE